MTNADLMKMGLSSIQELETDTGILASGRDEIYACTFGRDSLITVLMLMRLHEKEPNAYYVALSKKILINLAELQGKSVNIESGEEPGRMIHEYRPDKHEHLSGSHNAMPWFVYPDGCVRNYDTADATALFLRAVYAYARITKDAAFMDDMLPHVKSALDWLLEYGDRNGDGLFDYTFVPERTHGGLVTQSWMDSFDSAFMDDGVKPEYPIAPVEVQAYDYAALREWARFFTQAGEGERTSRLNSRANVLKRAFNEHFVLFEESEFSLAFAIDGLGRPMKSARSSMGHVLWAAVEDDAGQPDCVLNADLIPRLVERLMKDDLFKEGAGIRTLSTQSPSFEVNSYHNGSFWPHDNELVAEGLENFGYIEEATRIRKSLLQVYLHFGAPLEFFAYDDGYSDFLTVKGRRTGQVATKSQAWSAAALLSALSASVVVK